MTSSIAISTVFLFLFSNTGAVNALLESFGHRRAAVVQRLPGPAAHLSSALVGVGDNPVVGRRARSSGRSLWDWLSGPSVAMCVIIILAIWTTTGTFMLMFLAALQDLPVEIDEAAALDGVSWWQKLRLVTMPMLSPAIFLVTTLGPDRHLAGLRPDLRHGQGRPAGTTLTPAFLSYQQSFTLLPLRDGCGDGVHRLPHHRRPDLAAAAGHGRGPGVLARAPASDPGSEPAPGLHPCGGGEHPMSVVTRPPVDAPAADARTRTPASRRGAATRKAAAYTLLVLVAAVFIYPFLIQIATSFKTDPDAAAHPLSLVPEPVRPHRVEAHLRPDAGTRRSRCSGGSATRSSSPSS